MFQNRPLLFLGLAVGIALVTTVLIYNWLQGQRAPEPVEQEVVTLEGMSIAVAKEDVSWGTPLTMDKIRLVTFPEDSLPKDHFTKMEDLDGRIVLTRLNRNEPILESKLAPIDIKTGGVAAVIDPKKRAMAVKVNEVVALPGFVKPGDRVDVMVTLTEEGKKTQITKTVLENMLVLATGTQMERGPEDKPTPVKIITFEVSLVEAEKLAMASNGGQLRLALRSPINADLEKTRGATFHDLKASFQAAPKAKGRRKPKTRVEVIKGNAKSVVKF